MAAQSPDMLPLRVSPIAHFTPTASSRAWISVPNPNGLPLIATGTSDKTVRVYSLKTFTLHSTLEGGHSRSVRTVTWKPANPSKQNEDLNIASGSFDATIGLWRRKADVDDRNVGNEETLEHEITLSGGVSLEDDSDGSEAEEEWGFMLVLEGHDSEVKHVSYSHSGQFLASCSRDKSIWIWEEVGDEGEDEWETVAVLQDHEADVKFVCWREYDGDGEVLASACYDDTIRLFKEAEEGEWQCYAVLGGEDQEDGHKGTVWSLAWEPEISHAKFGAPGATADLPRTPRLMSSSADCTIAVWSPVITPAQNKPSYINSGIPSTMRPSATNETWTRTETLPKAHEYPIYSIDWSKKTGRVVSSGGDGKVVIYEEQTKPPEVDGEAIDGESATGTEWVIIGVLESAHGPYEVNHVTWCTRYDPGRSKDGEEMIVTTGDDGLVKAWAVSEIELAHQTQAMTLGGGSSPTVPEM